ncbi:hypothetical protein Nepgr_028463 [Nepenthes gracilis]|uniref:Cytochrome P450 76AD1-like protein n=1 Tax=Nepenthes gracilis TaxID=150966 RepID=A0AAD3TBR6_NEPGR|nr:hypothetical protein Nepgr_028463 [Nepenthes gracilis]
MVGLSFLSWLLLSCLFVHFLIRLKSAKANVRKLPPGPFPLPIFGNIFQLGDKPHRSMAELAKIYGPIITLQLGQLTTIVISSAAMAKEVIQKNDLSFCTRHIVDSARALNHHEFSMVWLPISAPWRNLRKISNSHLFSSTRLDASRHLRQKKVGELLAYLQSICDTGVAVEIGKVAFQTSLNLLSNTLLSEDLVEFWV